MKLTNANVGRCKLPPGKSDVIFWDDELPRFGLRVRAGGGRVWIVQYRTDSGQRREKIGTVPALDADAARRKAKQTLAKVQLGHDPVAEKREKKARAAETFGAIVGRFLAYKKKSIRPRYYQEMERHLMAQAKPLHGLPLASIERRTVAARLGEIAETSGASAADPCRASLSAYFAWAVREGLLVANPAVNTNRYYENEPRERVLSDTELRTIWATLPADYDDGPDQYAAIVKLLLLTGQRRQEIGGLRWPEVDLDREVINLPGERTKNHRDHIVPLSAPAIEILSALPRREGRDLVFGFSGGSYSGWSAAKARLDGRAKLAESWTLHDLRRTVVTRMGDLGVLPHVVEAITNHVSGFRAGVSGVYNLAKYEPEMRRALDLWSDHVMALVEGRASNVVALARPA